MTVSLYSVYPYTISNQVILDDQTLPATYSYGSASVTGSSVVCVDQQECSTDLVVEITPSACAVSETLLFNFTAIESPTVSHASQSEFIIRADFCDTFLGTLDGLSGAIALYDSNPTS